MYTKLLAASVLTIGLATSAMAQSSDSTYSNNHDWWPFGNGNHRASIPPPPEASTATDPGLNTLGNPGPVGPCASNTAGPDANAEGNVNDQYCGK